MMLKTTSDEDQIERKSSYLQCLPRRPNCGQDIRCKSQFMTFVGCIFNFFLFRKATSTSEKFSTPEVVEKQSGVSLLDLPETTLECILECLSPPELCRVSTVCAFLRDKCRSHHLWENHMKQKWSRVVGDAAFQEWRRHKALSKKVDLFINGRYPPLESLGSSHGHAGSTSEARSQWSSSLIDDSVMAWCISLESGKFWFPAQVFAGKDDEFMLYWYDALLNYDYRSDTFRARYPHDGWQITLTDITWDMVRAPVVDVSPYALHTSDCLNDLRPGDLVETQWRFNREDPYDWWYGVIAHLEQCDTRSTHCRCQYSGEKIIFWV